MKIAYVAMIMLAVGPWACSSPARRHARLPSSSAATVDPAVCRAAPRGVPQTLAEVDPDAPPPPPGFALRGDRIHLKLHQGQMLVVEGPSGTTIIEITEFSEGAARYRWRARSRSGAMGRGTGTLVERLAPARNDPSRQEDVGSELLIGAGLVTVEWSYASLQSGWLYLDPQMGTSRVVSSDQFESFVFPGDRRR